MAMKWLAILALLLTGISGCASGWNSRGDAFDGDEQSLSSLMGKLRPADNSLDGWGFSTKAQQIENSMGVR